ncbi:hypothetical protein GCM10027586_03010 [Kineococcus gypseus]
MCATVLWAISSTGWTPAFEDFTRRCLQVAPQRFAGAVRSARMPRDAVLFTLTANVCDCDCLVGLGDRPVREAEVPAAAWLGWLRQLPAHAAGVRRVVLARSWQAGGESAWVPARAREVRIDVVDEDWLRRVPEETLFTIDYPRDYPGDQSHAVGAASTG